MSEPEPARRAIRVRVGRLRRRIDRRLRWLGRDGWQAALWSRWAQRHPGQVVFCAVALGVILSMIRHPDRWARRLGGNLIRQSAARLLAAVASELQGLCKQFAPEKRGADTTPSSGEEHA